MLANISLDRVKAVVRRGCPKLPTASLVPAKRTGRGFLLPARQIIVPGMFLFALSLARAEHYSAHPFETAQGKTEKSNR